MKQSTDWLTELGGEGREGKELNNDRGGVGDSNFLCLEYDGRAN